MKTPGQYLNELCTAGVRPGESAEQFWERIAVKFLAVAPSLGTVAEGDQCPATK